MSVNLEVHGGYCCGRYHIYEFEGYGERPKDWIEKVKEILNRDNYDLDDYEEEVTLEEMCCEITLTEQQALQEQDGKTFESMIKKIGFEEVYRFNNPNSGNIVRVYMYSSNKVEITDD